jgi:hypothetical protein
VSRPRLGRPPYCDEYVSSELLQLSSDVCAGYSGCYISKGRSPDGYLFHRKSLSWSYYASVRFTVMSLPISTHRFVGISTHLCIHHPPQILLRRRLILPRMPYCFSRLATLLSPGAKTWRTAGLPDPIHCSPHHHIGMATILNVDSQQTNLKTNLEPCLRSSFQIRRSWHVIVAIHRYLYMTAGKTTGPAMCQ